MSTPAGSRPLDLLTIGDPCADLVVHTERVPDWDDKCIGRAGGLFAGGTESNVACAAARLGLKVAAIGEVGDDHHGRFLLDDFARHGVDTRAMVRRPRRSSSTTLILVSPVGERAVVWIPLPPRPRPQAPLIAALRRCRQAYTMPYDVDQLATLAALAHESGAEMVVDIEREAARTAGAMPRMLQHCDIAFMNETGFRTETGQAPSLDGLQSMRAQGRAHTVVCTLGAQGALAVAADGQARQAAFPARVVDSTGAGDGFNAAFLAARRDGLALQPALAFACAAASLVVEATGARSGLPTLAQVQARMAGAP